MTLPPDPPEPEPKLTEVRYEHSPDFAALLESIGATLFISTYQAGRLVVVGVRDGKLHFSFHAFEQCMGMAVSPGRIAIGTRRDVWMLRRAKDLAPTLPDGPFDDCFLARHAHHTGRIHIHDLSWGRDELWIVNTLFSCLCTLDMETNFVPRWKPPFISALAGDDRCHLNGLAMEAGVPKYVTVLARTDTPAGWRPDKAKTGCLLDVPSGEPVVQGLSMPHSPRVHGGRVWLLESGHGRLSLVDAVECTIEPVAHLPGYTRGLAFAGRFAFVGLSKIRETNIFGGLPIATRRADLKCGIGVVDLSTGQLAGQLEFLSGVEEIFDVQILAGTLNPAIRGPSPDSDGQQQIWLAGTPRWVESF
ncbi:TIGR03032 family protein [soil metagenome]